MAPKRKGKKGKGKGTPVVDGLAPEDMSKEQVEEHVCRIREELDREREERNYFQLERDKIHTFWEITRRQLEEKKAELRNKDREMEEAEERHQVEIKVYKQKVKHLLYEHQNNLTEMKAEGTVVMKLAQKEHCAQEDMLRKDMRALKVELKEQELANEVVVKNLRLEQMEDMRKKEEHLEKEMAEVSVQNKRLADPLQKARDEMNEMQKKLGNYERDKQILVVSLHLNSSPASAPSPGPRRGGRPVKAGSGELRPSFL
uniref:Dynein regulatory complex subunit 4 n=1 Tax=Equus caballus TaxID=9796 RepID=A0A9L0S6J6_HORSE